jgi:hypothetical protein
MLPLVTFFGDTFGASFGDTFGDILADYSDILTAFPV